MNVVHAYIPGVVVIEPKVFEDNRGWFMESWSYSKMKGARLEYNFVQDNHSFSAQANVLRGIHFQQDPHSQAKLVRVVRGMVLDVVVDIREGSPTYKKWVAVELSEENKRQLLIPRGFGHAFLALTNNVELLYKADNLYNADADRNIRWNDPDLGIDWGTSFPTLSDKDANAPFLINSDCNYRWE